MNFIAGNYLNKMKFIDAFYSFPDHLNWFYVILLLYSCHLVWRFSFAGLWILFVVLWKLSLPC